MSRRFCLAALVLMVCVAAVSWAAGATGTQTKSGKVKSIDANARTFVLDLSPNRPLTFTVNDKTVVTLDGKDSTFVAAIKVDAKATVTYTRNGEDRVATKVEVTSAATTQK